MKTECVFTGTHSVVQRFGRMAAKCPFLVSKLCLICGFYLFVWIFSWGGFLLCILSWPWSDYVAQVNLKFPIILPLSHKGHNYRLWSVGAGSMLGIYLCIMYVYVHVPQCTCGGLGATLGTQFFPLTMGSRYKTWVIRLVQQMLLFVELFP